MITQFKKIKIIIRSVFNKKQKKLTRVNIRNNNSSHKRKIKFIENKQ
jgi:hypothetical protein